MPTQKQRDNFSIANRCIGWGDPHDAIWFVGMEEGKQWESQRSIDDFEVDVTNVDYQCTIPDDNENAVTAYWRPHNQITKNGQVERAESFVAAKTFGFEPEQFRQEKLWRLGQRTFHANLFPLGRMRGKDGWPAQYDDLFGFPTYDDYKKEVERTRLQWLSYVATKMQPIAIVCFGVGEHRLFQQTFCKQENPKRGAKGEQFGFDAFEQSRVIIVPHFSHGHFAKVQNSVVEQLKRWRIDLP